MFLEHQICILKIFLIDHVTLRTGCFAITEINYIVKYNKVENSYFKL